MSRWIIAISKSSGDGCLHTCTRTSSSENSESPQRASAWRVNHGGFRKRGYSGDWKHRSDSVGVGKQHKEHGKDRSVTISFCGGTDIVLFCRSRARWIESAWSVRDRLQSFGLSMDISTLQIHSWHPKQTTCIGFFKIYGHVEIECRAEVVLFNAYVNENLCHVVCKHPVNYPKRISYWGEFKLTGVLFDIEMNVNEYEFTL